MQTAFELTEEIKCFTELRKKLLARKRKTENSPKNNLTDVKHADIKTTNLSNQLKIVERHLLKCFQEREEVS